MGKDPDAIRQEIQRTRAEMSETVEAIGYRADVPSRAKEAVTGKVEAVKEKVSDTATRARERGQEHGQDLAESARRNAQDVQTEARSSF